MFDKITKVLGFAAGGAVIGTTTLAAGPLGAAIGVPAGAVFGFCIGLALGMYNLHESEKQMKKKL